MQIVEMNDFDQLFHHQDETGINILHYSVLTERMDTQIHLNHTLKINISLIFLPLTTLLTHTNIEALLSSSIRTKFPYLMNPSAFYLVSSK